MLYQVISTKVHGYLDWLTVGAQLFVPRVLGFGRPATAIHGIMAASTATGSLFTNYELGAIKAMPMKTHLTLDAIGGGILMGAALLLRNESCTARSVMASVGALYLAAGLMTRTQPERAKRRMQGPIQKSAMEQYAEDRRPAAARPRNARIASSQRLPAGYGGPITEASHI